MLVASHVVTRERVLEVARDDLERHSSDERLGGLEEREPAVVHAGHRRVGVRGAGDDVRAFFLVFDLKRSVDRERLLHRLRGRRCASIGATGGEGHVGVGVLAPATERLARFGDELVVLGGREFLVQRDARALERLVESEQFPRGVGLEEHAPRLAIARGVDSHEIGRAREDADEADAELADLGEVVLLGAAELGDEVVLDDVAVHALAPVGDRDERDAFRISGAPAERDLDAVAARVDAVLNQLSIERERVRELVDEFVDDAAAARRHGRASCIELSTTLAAKCCRWGLKRETADAE
ncbi:MAG: hypothetical protein QM817_26170 [Archangium sp.]